MISHYVQDIHTFVICSKCISYIYGMFLTPGKVKVRSYGGSFALWKKGQRTHISFSINCLHFTNL